jgi:lipoate-protein ligase A
MALRALSGRLSAAQHHHPLNLNLSLTKSTRRLIQPSSRFFSAEAVSNSSNVVQVYISRSTDPYLNLSIEHFLLQKSHPDSVVLFLYTNRPCIVIGRNQNPWVEVNLGLAKQPGILEKLRAAERKTGDAEDNGDGDVLLVRRRSGGGTVFHDAGNVNYSVICPPASFDRNKHALMVVRALRSLNNTHTSSVRVNERHDIVLDISLSLPQSQTETGMEVEGAVVGGGGEVKTYKISGSAYKLTRTRSLHHGTCLLSSPHLSLLSQLLRSPAAPYIKARGVESVRSPVRNVGVPNGEFEDAVVAEFKAMYQDQDKPTNSSDTEKINDTKRTNKIKVQILDTATVAHIPEVQAGVAELRSRDWIFAQTPQFTFSSHPTADDPRPRPDLPADLPASFFPTTPNPALDLDSTTGTTGVAGLQMTVRQAQITHVASPRTSTDGNASSGESTNHQLSSLKGLHLHHVKDWCLHVGSEHESVGRWLNELFGVGSERDVRIRDKSPQ